MLAPLGLEKFFSGFWLQRPLHLERVSDFSDLLTAADVDTLLRFADMKLRVVKYRNGESVPFEIRSSGKAPDVYAIYDAWNRGYSLSIDDLQLYWPAAMEFCQRIESALTIPAGVNIYFTPPGAQCFPPHYDAHEVLVMQLEGEKKWTVWNPLDESRLPLKGNSVDNPENLPAPCMEPTLRQGDVLYIPRGYPHQAVSTDERTLHITLQLIAPTRKDVRTLTMQAVQHMKLATVKQIPADFNDDSRFPDLTRSLPLGFMESEVLDEAFIDLLGANPAKLASNEVKKALVHGMSYNQQPAVTGYFRGEKQFERIGDDTALRKRSFGPCRTDAGPGKSLLLFHRQMVMASAEMSDSLSYIAMNECFCLNDLPGPASHEEKRRILIELLKKGLLAIDDR